jgi:flavorubredoxin
MKPFAIRPNIYWTGALHPDLRIFDIIMRTKNGTTYNSYLVKGEKIAVIDTVKGKFSSQFLQNIGDLVDPANIDYIIVQHTEPDHSGSLVDLMKAAPRARVICSKAAVKYIQNTTNTDVEPVAAQTISGLDLGGFTLQFIPAPFLHWPDTMMTYLIEEKILFPCDVFGSHFCDSRMYDDQITRNFWPDFKYYFDMIMRPYKKSFRNVNKKLQELDIQCIAPSHGPVLRAEIDKYMDAYAEWTAPLPANDPPKMIIYFISAHGNTEKMAQKIAEGASSQDVNVEVFDLQDIDFGGHLDRIERSDAVIVGSPTINNDAAKPVWDVLGSLVTLDLKGKLGASFGSYGWSGEATKFLDDRLNALKFNVPFEGLTSVLVPSEEELRRSFDFGVQLAKMLKKEG